MNYIGQESVEERHRALLRKMVAIQCELTRAYLAGCQEEALPTWRELARTAGRKLLAALRGERAAEGWRP
jgi:hypothetical protein